MTIRFAQFPDGFVAYLTNAFALDAHRCGDLGHGEMVTADTEEVFDHGLLTLVEHVNHLLRCVCSGKWAIRSRY